MNVRQKFCVFCNISKSENDRKRKKKKENAMKHFEETC